MKEFLMATNSRNMKPTQWVEREQCYKPNIGKNYSAYCKEEGH